MIVTTAIISLTGVCYGRETFFHACCLIWERGVAYTGFWWGNLRGRDRLEDPRVDGKVTLRWIFRKWDVGVWTGSI